MAKKKKKKFKKDLFNRICERCGNEVFSKKKVFTCFFCDYINGAEGK